MISPAYNCFYFLDTYIVVIYMFICIVIVIVIAVHLVFYFAEIL